MVFSLGSRILLDVSWALGMIFVFRCKGSGLKFFLGAKRDRGHLMG